ncbi:MAG: HNH endonuclease signature motif containing protein [Terracidiphilus sp.]
MKKIDQETVKLIREHALSNPNDTYNQIAASFGVSEITVKRYCSDLGRSKKQYKRPTSNGEFDPNRLWAQVDRNRGECWYWTGCTNSSGYGFIYAQGRNLAVHHLAYQLEKGPVPEGMELDHTCRNRTCCNPDHLEPVTHVENMLRAGLIPPRRPSAIDTRPTNLDTVRAIDTEEIGACASVKDSVVPLLKAQGIKGEDSDTSHPLIPVSIAASGPSSDHNTGQRMQPLITLRPQRPDPYAPLCTMAEPAVLELVQRPERHEPPRGTKEDLGIDDWAVTEFGDFWWRQSDEDLRNRSVFGQTEALREAGEFLHWYRVNPLDPEKTATFMSARTGPEACVKVERNLGKKGWAHSWEYLRPDPHRGPFFQYTVQVLYKGHVVPLGPVARTANDAISMVEAVWGPGYVVSCELLRRPPDGHLWYWINHWREALASNLVNVRKKYGDGPPTGASNSGARLT